MPPSHELVDCEDFHVQGRAVKCDRRCGGSHVKGARKRKGERATEHRTHVKTLFSAKHVRAKTNTLNLK